MPDSMYDKLGELLSEAQKTDKFLYENPYTAQKTQQKSYEKEKIIDPVQKEKKNRHNRRNVFRRRKKAVQKKTYAISS